ncbi:glycosyltransferase family A protein [Thalassospira sp. TSL5-1]|uniref:glycosyltransferase family 2 protein n=1 Tax=Thalassospira sp. TSL5-1 TaxID=1544451 RepID=UPI00093BE3BD|nr:glycosyltransferase family A protein [Thalassospira sp. TSL5-1]OKH87451.1 hypothetical protein LF95_11640 [Thalassospira sp. TSL5-1]
MTLSKPMVTAALCSFNAAKTISAALNSAFAQDWPTLEVLVIDDASTDDTINTIEKFIQDKRNKYPSFRLLKNKENLGVASCRNRLIEAAQGEYIAFFDDDDISHPQRISKQMARLAEAERTIGHDLAICHSSREQIYPNGVIHYEQTMGGENGKIPAGDAVVDRILLGRITPNVTGSCATCSQLGRKSVYLQLGGFDESLRRAEDTDFAIRLAMAGGAFAGLDEPLVRQLMTPGDEKRLEAEHEAYVALLHKHQGFLALHGWLGFSKKWQDARLLHLQGHKAALFWKIALIGMRYPFKTLQKLFWSLPASATRRHQKCWHDMHKKTDSL